MTPLPEPEPSTFLQTLLYLGALLLIGLVGYMIRKFALDRQKETFLTQLLVYIGKYVMFLPIGVMLIALFIGVMNIFEAVAQRDVWLLVHYILYVALIGCVFWFGGRMYSWQNHELESRERELSKRRMASNFS